MYYSVEYLWARPLVASQVTGIGKGVETENTHAYSPGMHSLTYSTHTHTHADSKSQWNITSVCRRVPSAFSNVLPCDVPDMPL